MSRCLMTNDDTFDLFTSVVSIDVVQVQGARCACEVRCAMYLDFVTLVSSALVRIRLLQESRYFNRFPLISPKVP